MTKIFRIGKIGNSKGNDFRIPLDKMTDGEVSVALKKRKMELILKINPGDVEAKRILTQLNAATSISGFGIGNIPSHIDNDVKRFLNNAKSRKHSAVGNAGEGTKTYRASKKILSKFSPQKIAAVGGMTLSQAQSICDNKFPYPASMVPTKTKVLYRAQCGTSSTCYDNKIKTYHNTNLGRSGLTAGCINAEMKASIINDYMEDGAASLAYFNVNDSELSDRAFLKKGFQGLFASSIQTITGLSESNLRDYIENSTLKVAQSSTVGLVNAFRNSPRIGDFGVTAIVAIIAAVAAASATIIEAVNAGKQMPEYARIGQDLPTSLEQFTPTDLDFGSIKGNDNNGGNGNGGNGNGNSGNGNGSEESNNLLYVGAASLVALYLFKDKIFK